jgi:hypothetical protein
MKLKKKHFNFINYLKKQILIKINQTWKKNKLKGYFKKLKSNALKPRMRKKEMEKKTLNWRLIGYTCPLVIWVPMRIFECGRYTCHLNSIDDVYKHVPTIF